MVEAVLTPGAQPIVLRSFNLARRERFDTALALVVIALSGNMALIDGPRRWITLSLFGFVCLVLLLARYGSRAFTRRFLFVTAVFAGLGAVHLLTLRGAAIVPVFGFLVRVFCAYAVVRLTGGFTRAYTRAMVLLALLGLAVFLPDQVLLNFGFDARSLLEPIQNAIGVGDDFNVGFHNFQEGASIHRNAGMFWEPGAFAGYLVLALVFVHLDRDSYAPRTRHFILIVLFVALASTQSTMGYIAGLMVAGLHALSFGARRETRKTRRSAGLGIAVLAVGTVAMIVASLGFMTPKITELYERASTRAPGWELSRFGSAVFDWEYIRQRPLSGWGAGLETRYQLNPELTRFGMGNGLTDFAAKYGVGGLVVFIAATFTALRKRAGTRTAVIGALIIIATLNGEWFLGHPVFLALMFL